LERSLIAERLALLLAAPNLRVAFDCNDENDAQHGARACYTGSSQELVRKRPLATAHRSAMTIGRADR